MSPIELRRLLELAAKAAGYTTQHPWNDQRMLMRPPVPGLLVLKNGQLLTTLWNPAEDDGEALRLAVVLGLFNDDDFISEIRAIWEYPSQDQGEDVRKIILRYAVAIGEPA